MEYEISDQPQGGRDALEADRTAGLPGYDDGLNNQSSIDAKDYPEEERKDASLVQKDKKRAAEKQPS